MFDQIPRENKEAASLTGMHISIILALPTFLFISCNVLLAFRKARSKNPSIDFREWMNDTLHEYASFTYMQGQDNMPMMSKKETISHHLESGGMSSSGTEVNSKKPQGMTLSKPSKVPKPLAKKPPPASTSRPKDTTDDWDNWGSEDA